MSTNIVIFTGIFFATLLSHQLLAVEVSIEDLNKQQLLISESQEESENSIIIENPLLSEHEEHGQLLLSSYDPEHNVYPIRIISIDNWLLTEQYFGQDILLNEGEHRIKVAPDFSNITPQKVFMNNLWPEKHVTFRLLNKQKIAVVARLLNNNTLEWNVHMYLVELPVEGSAADNSSNTDERNQ